MHLLTCIINTNAISVYNGILQATQENEPWRRAWNRNLREQAIMNNIIKEIMNMIIRNIGWIALDIYLYGGKNLLKF